jgi:hypothetical protein
MRWKPVKDSGPWSPGGCSRDEMHRFSKVPAEALTLVEGVGVAGDAHAGTLVQHRSRVRRDPNQPNLRASGHRIAQPLRQINEHSSGLLKLVVARLDGVASTTDVALGATGGAESIDGVGLLRKAGIMAVRAWRRCAPWHVHGRRSARRTTPAIASCRS